MNDKSWFPDISHGPLIQNLAAVLLLVRGAESYPDSDSSLYSDDNI